MEWFAHDGVQHSCVAVRTCYRPPRSCVMVFNNLLTMVFSTVAWCSAQLRDGVQHSCVVAGRLSARQATTEDAREAIKQRRRLFHIAVMITACLLVMMGALLYTSLALGEWTRTADISLACAIKETSCSRNWEACGFDEGGIVEVHSAKDSIQVSFPCQGGYFWHPSVLPMV